MTLFYTRFIKNNHDYQDEIKYFGLVFVLCGLNSVFAPLPCVFARSSECWDDAAPACCAGFTLHVIRHVTTVDICLIIDLPGNRITNGWGVQCL